MANGVERAELDRKLGDLWHFYDEHAAQARQHEDLRATVTSILAGFAAAVVGFAGIDGLERSDVPAGLVVVVLGILGALLSFKHYERNRFHAKVMKAARGEITRLEKEPTTAAKSTSDLREKGKSEHAHDFSLAGKKESEGPWIVRVHLFHLWLALPLAIALVGLVIVVVALA